MRTVLLLLFLITLFDHCTGRHKPLSTATSTTRQWTTVDQFPWTFCYEGDGEECTVTSSEPLWTEVGFDATDWSPIHLPHTWNAFDGQTGPTYKRGPGYYRLLFTFDNSTGPSPPQDSNTNTNRHSSTLSSSPSRQLYVQFDAANIVAQVWLNGKYLGTHSGGYSAFRFNLTPFLQHTHSPHSDNVQVLAIMVNNSYTADVAPLTADFTFFGGLYRSVHLLTVPPLHFQLDNSSSSSLSVTTSQVSSSSASVTFRSSIFNHFQVTQTAWVQWTVRDSDNTTVTVLTSEQQNILPNSGLVILKSFTLPSPRLWRGKADPHLYSVSAVLYSSTIASPKLEANEQQESREVRGTVELDSVVEQFGVRDFVLNEKGFFLNGDLYHLHGVNLHQDRLNKGWAIAISDLEEDFSFIKEIGATAVRLSHYQHDQHLLTMGDQLGIIFWAEIPFINSMSMSPAFRQTTEQQLRELIRQNANHPSIIFWSIANEIRGPPDPNDLLKSLSQIVKQEDPSRISTMASCCVDESDPINMHTDTRGFNRYYGWYSDEVEDFGIWADGVRKRFPNMTFSLSEYGAGASIHHHEPFPRKPKNTGDHFHSEEYQSYLHERTWTQIKQRNCFWGTFIWNLFDFAVAQRDEGDTSGRNDKGLATYDRLVKKDAFFFYKAQWTSSPFVYITCRRFWYRTLTTTDVKVYSNLPTVQLIVNSVDMGKQAPGEVPNMFLWSSVRLREGINDIIALANHQGANITDHIQWEKAQSIRINAGSRLPFWDNKSQYYDVDHFYTSGSPASTSAQISNTTSPALYQSFRTGKAINYSIPVDSDSRRLYRIRLGFVEPTKTAPGQRVFDIHIEGVLVFPKFDVFKSAGGINIATQVEAMTRVTDSLLSIHLLAKVDSAILAVISVD